VSYNLLTVGKSTPKLLKSDNSGLGWRSGIVYLAPHKMSGSNFCPAASAGCIASCLNTAGRGKTRSVQAGRLRRSQMFIEDREAFKSILHKEIGLFVKYNAKRGFRTCIRLNGTSDLSWEKLWPELFREFASVQFYDYTKISKRYDSFLNGKLPKNYHLTFSHSERNLGNCLEFLHKGGSVAIVWKTKDIIPKYFCGFDVHDADETDLRFLDKPGVQALYAKGRAKHDKTGFIYA
jgi:hypothetical protein